MGKHDQSTHIDIKKERKRLQEKKKMNNILKIKIYLEKKERGKCQNQIYESKYKNKTEKDKKMPQVSVQNTDIATRGPIHIIERLTIIKIFYIYLRK